MLPYDQSSPPTPTTSREGLRYGSSQQAEGDRRSGRDEAAPDHGRSADRSAGERAGQGGHDGSIKERVQEQLNDAVEGVKREAVTVGERLRDQCRGYLDGRKDYVAGEIEHVSAAVNDSAKRLHDSQDDRLASYATTVATQLDAVRDYLRDRDTGQLIEDAATCARRRLDLFFGGLFVMGLLAGRVLRASREARDKDERRQMLERATGDWDRRSRSRTAAQPDDHPDEQRSGPNEAGTNPARTGAINRSDSGSASASGA